MANRLPVDFDPAADSKRRWTASPGGLVSALEPLLRSRKGAWVGWPGVPDAEIDEFDDDGLVLHPVTLTSDGTKRWSFRINRTGSAAVAANGTMARKASKARR